MSQRCQGLFLGWESLACLARRSPLLQDAAKSGLVALTNALVSISLDSLRVLLHWSENGDLLFERQHATSLHHALTALGITSLAQDVERFEVKGTEVQHSDACVKAASIDRPKAMVADPKQTNLRSFFCRNKATTSEQPAAKVQRLIENCNPNSTHVSSDSSIRKPQHADSHQGNVCDVGSQGIGVIVVC